ncbi:MAG: EamA family transporter [Candidatus Magasanikbacteria bacterium]|nr:EamA family transporter [Candidatus Magasanikbacteria bacterium]
MWFLLSLGSAFFDSLKDVTAKIVSKEIDAYTVAWANRFFGLIFILPVMLFNIPNHLGIEFWKALAVVGVLNSINSVLYIKALKDTPLSIVTPITSLTPITVLLFSSILASETPSLVGFLGIIIAVIGTYVLQISQRHTGFLKPLTSLWTNVGQRYVFIVVILWGITSVFDKIAIQHSNPLFYLGAANIVYTLALFPFVIFKPGRLQIAITNYKKFLPVGFFYAVSTGLQFLALPFTLVSYVLSIKRASSVFGVIWGKFFFNETNLRERMFGSLIIIAGVILIIFA